jgi:hypothetical protein
MSRLASGVAIALVCGTGPLAAGGVPAATADVKVTEVVTNGRVFATFSAPDAFTDDVRKVMQSGLLLTFTFTVELKRPSTIWLDRKVGATTVAASATFDGLTSQYKVSRLRDGRVITKSERLEKEGDVRTWLTAFDQVPVEVTEPLEPNADYYLRVSLRTTPRPTMSFWPLFGRDDGSGRKDFTFIR